MSIDTMFGQTINLIAKNLDMRARSHEYIAGNIANMETPNYTPKSLSFEKELQETVGRKQQGVQSSATTHPRHIPLKGVAGKVEEVQGVVEERPSRSMSRDGNGVDMEVEMGRLAENQILFNASIQILAKKFEGLKYAIKGGN
jgi:flagellar basal-body rod protein FlgB